MEIKNHIPASVAPPERVEMEQGENPVPVAPYTDVPGTGTVVRGMISTPDYTVSFSSEGRKMSQFQFDEKQRSDQREFQTDQKSEAREEKRRQENEEARFENKQQREESRFEAGQRMERIRFMQSQNTRDLLINQIV